MKDVDAAKKSGIISNYYYVFFNFLILIIIKSMYYLLSTGRFIRNSAKNDFKISKICLQLR